MEQFLKKELGYTFIKRSGQGGGGCISQGEMFNTDKGRIFVKENSKDGARKMFEGEFASLEAIQNTNTIKVPRPIKVLDRPHGPGALLVMEFLDMRGCSKQAELGKALAELHLANIKVKDESQEKKDDTSKFVKKFGFHTETCCGFLPQGNNWTEQWVDFYTQKLNEQISRQKDGELQSLWSLLQPKISTFFEDLEIYPSLLHGDLWSGNIAQSEGTPVVFDPASFYGHHEYDLAIGRMFGGFDAEFSKAYHAIIPKQPGFDKRSELYQLFHYLNHWNHFGGGYKFQSLTIMRNLAKIK